MGTKPGNFSFSVPGLGSSYGGSSAGVGALGTALEVGTPAAFPWAAVIPVVWNLLSATGIFGDEQDDQYDMMKKQQELQIELLNLQRKWQVQDRSRSEARADLETARKASSAQYAVDMTRPALPFYQSPFTGAVDQTAMEAIMNQVNRTKNWGATEGFGQVSYPGLDTLLGGGAGNISDIGAQAARQAAAASAQKAALEAAYKKKLADQEAAAQAFIDKIKAGGVLSKNGIPVKKSTMPGRT